VLDLAIRGGLIVDGTGAPGTRGDIGVADGRIVAAGEVPDSAAIEIDAGDHVVAPGFVDGHTHYDAQLWWDPACTPSPRHGTTTAIAGNCGMSLAPVAKDDGFLLRLLARVEGIPLAAVEAAVELNWKTFGELLDAIDEHGTGINVAIMVGHSALRRAVMGEAGSERAATPTELDAMCWELHKALSAGGLGLSSATVATQVDGDGRPTPPCSANRSEFLALATACGAHPSTCLEMTPASYLRGFDPDDTDLLSGMSVAANRHLNWNPVLVNRGDPTLHERQLAASDIARVAGGLVVPFVAPQNGPMQHDFLTAYVFRALPGWSSVFALDPHERIRALADPTVREHLRRSLGAESAGLAVTLRDNWGRYIVNETPAGPLRALGGRSIDDIATERGITAFDAILDIAVAGDLDVGFVRYPYPADDQWLTHTRAELMHDPRVVLGASDAGAHLDMMVGADFPTRAIAELVRDRQVFTLEELIHQFTDRPARLFGLRDRGRLAVGAIADIVVFDPATVNAGPLQTAHDLPTGAPRLITEPVGVPHVLVGGHAIVHDGTLTGDRAGTVLRSGRDTDTVPARLT
jgi:N-acyl-D-aspartate/D-glutamate deacylase